MKNAQTSEGLSWVVIRFLDPWHMPLLFGLVVIVPPQAHLARLAPGRHLSHPSFYADFWRIRGDMNGYKVCGPPLTCGSSCTCSSSR